MTDFDGHSIADRAILLATELLQRARELQTPQERRQQSELDRMIGHDDDKATLVEMTDQAFRTQTPARVADQLTHLLDIQGIPRFFSPIEQAMLRGFQSFGEFLPGVAVPLVKEKMRNETANVILPAEPDVLVTHLADRQRSGVSMNVNLLGEALLGEEDARRRIKAYLDLLRMPDVRCLSVKISTVYSQVSALSRDHTIRMVADRMETIYRNANHAVGPNSDHDGVDQAPDSSGKFVYLDMEEYADLHLTAEVLTTTLDRRGLEQTRAGIALQAYVPDSYDVMNELISWSRKRSGSGGRPLTIRLVKGANMEMERVHASVAGWPHAPYPTKLETDANFKRMLRALLEASAEGVVRVGVASHNLFDVALAMLWVDELGCRSAAQFEMLEGMANHQRRAISEKEHAMLLYAPACRKDDFLNAIGYLIRRLDENTGPENFLRHSYRLAPGTADFDRLAGQFKTSLEMMDSVSTMPRHQQDRNTAPEQVPVADHWSRFVNEADTDWALPVNSRWASGVLQRWRGYCHDAAWRAVPVTIDQTHGVVNASVDREMMPDVRGATDRDWVESLDVSRTNVVSCRYQLANLDEVKSAVRQAAVSSDWKNRSVANRHAVLRDVAQRIRQRRGDFIGAMVSDAGKSVAEADAEISEAIDFCEFYPLTMRDWDQRKTVRVEPRGVVAVITPWNFPLAIPAGGIAAALSAGCPVLLKPSEETILPAWLLCRAFWDAGVPIEALQLIPCRDEVAEQGVVRNPDIDTVILTGGTATAKRMLSVRPDLHLLAETGGKNATIVTAMADRDLAIKHVLQSAFGHSGQKCSATSLLLLEEEVFEDKAFQETLADATRSLAAGSAWDLDTRITPMVCPPNQDLMRGLHDLDPGESWLVMPERVDGFENLYRPGIKWNVRPGSFTHQTELFGPVLGVMRFRRLERAIEIVRSTGYGLTSGIESLDAREIELWRESITAGNLYINRSTTGAIVLRQPFGGVGLSAYGPGVKAGGPHYGLALSKISDADDHAIDETVNRPHHHGPLARLWDWMSECPAAEHLNDLQRHPIEAAVVLQELAVAEEFNQEHDTFRLVGQDNWRRYQCVDSMVIRVEESDSIVHAIIAVSASAAVGTQVVLSIDPAIAVNDRTLLESIADWLPGLVDPVQETVAELVPRLDESPVARVRCLSPTVDEALLVVCAKRFISVVKEPVIRDGRLECLRYLNEQSISHNYHRYGNLGRRQES